MEVLGKPSPMRTRQLKPGYFTNEDLGALPPLTRLFFAGLWTVADREGRLQDRPRKLKAMVMAYDDFDPEQAIADLAAGGFLIRYEAEGIACIQITNWHKHQTPHSRETDSELPPQLESLCTNQGCDSALPRQATQLLVTSNKQLVKKEKKYAGFTAPTVDEVRAYCNERKNKVNPETFVDYYTANGWRVGGRTAMKDWKASVRTWEKNDNRGSPGGFNRDSRKQVHSGPGQTYDANHPTRNEL